MIMILNVKPGFIKPRLFKVGIANGSIIDSPWGVPRLKHPRTWADACWVPHPRHGPAFPPPTASNSTVRSQDVAEPNGEATEGEEKKKKPKKKSKGSWNRITVFDPWQKVGRMLDESSEVLASESDAEENYIGSGHEDGATIYKMIMYSH